jgi:DNA-binding NarL/FixJ family response regulator
MTEAREPSRQRKAKVLVVDNHPVVRKGLAHIIDGEPDVRVCGEAASASEALKMAADLKPDLAIVDVSLRDGSGIELIKDLRVRHADLPVLVFSMHDEAFYAERVLRAGARGFVSKEEACATILTAIRRVLTGEVYVSEKMTSRMISKIVDAKPGAGTSPADLLTNRELEVFELAGQGLGTRQVAKRLFLSVKTVEAHREKIKKKLKLSSASELLQYALQWTQHEKKQ